MRILDLSEMRVSVLAREGVIVRCSRGRYDLEASVRNYVRRLRLAASNFGLLEYSEYEE